LSRDRFLLQGTSCPVRAHSFGWIELGQPEVKDFDPAIFRYEDVFRLEVAVNDSGIVCGRQSAG
jgi:hypothetical protein